VYPGATTHHLPELPLQEELRTFAEMGWEGVELSCGRLTEITASPDPEAAAVAAGAAAAALGLKMPQVHLLMGANLATADDTRREADLITCQHQVELAARAGIEVAVVHPGGDRPPTLAELQAEQARRIEAFARLGTHAAHYGVRIAIENTYDGGAVAGAAHGVRRFGAIIPELRELIDAVGLPNLGICLDTGHCQLMGIGMAEAVRQCGDRLFALHIDDNNGLADQHLCPFYGKVAWGPGMQALRAAGYQGIFNLEIGGGGRDVPDALRLPRLNYALQIARWLLTM